MRKTKKPCTAGTAQSIRSNDILEKHHYESLSNCITFDSSCKETYEIAGKSFPVIGYAKQPGYGRVPIVNIPMMSDYKWQLMALESRLKDPEGYTERHGEDVPAVIERLKDWLLEHIAQASGQDAERFLQLLKTI